MHMPGFTASCSLYRSSRQYFPQSAATPKVSGAVVSPQLPRSQGSGLVSNDCVDRYQACYVDCSLKYPDKPGTLNSEMRQGCLDSCDAAYNLCTSFGRGSGGLVAF
jgi:hypothetical protein